MLNFALRFVKVLQCTCGGVSDADVQRPALRPFNTCTYHTTRRPKNAQIERNLPLWSVQVGLFLVSHSGLIKQQNVWLALYLILAKNNPLIDRKRTCLFCLYMLSCFTRFLFCFTSHFEVVITNLLHSSCWKELELWRTAWYIFAYLLGKS